MKKIELLFFEDRFDLLESQFLYVNQAFFDSQFNFNVKDKISSDFNVSTIRDFDYILLDIELKEDSHRDGIGIFQLLESNSFSNEKISIITGHQDIDIQLKKRGLPIIQIFYKPIGITDAKEILTYIKSKI